MTVHHISRYRTEDCTEPLWELEYTACKDLVQMGFIAGHTNVVPSPAVENRYHRKG